MDDKCIREPLVAKQFVREARITMQLEYPNIVPFYELGLDGAGTPYINMRRIEGKVLEDLIPADATERLSVTSLSLFIGALVKVWDALVFAHSRGVIHRDIKPENIIVRRYGQMYLFDWGIALVSPDMAEEPVLVDADPLAKNSAGGPIIVGTPACMLPELVLAKR